MNSQKFCLSYPCDSLSEICRVRACLLDLRSSRLNPHPCPLLISPPALSPVPPDKGLCKGQCKGLYKGTMQRMQNSSPSDPPVTCPTLTPTTTSGASTILAAFPSGGCIFPFVLNISSARIGSVFPSDKSGHPKYGALCKQELRPHAALISKCRLTRAAILKVWFLSSHTVVLRGKRSQQNTGRGKTLGEKTHLAVFPKVHKTLAFREALEKRGLVLDHKIIWFINLPPGD